MQTQFQLGEIPVDVVLKDIKNVHLSVNPPSGNVRIAAPRRMKLDTIRVYAISKLRWIKQQQAKFQDQEREVPREFLERESHYVWGKRYLLHVVEADSAPTIQLRARKLTLQTRPGTTPSKRRELLEAWYRQQIRTRASELIAKWERTLGVTVKGILVRRMKTKWGSCSPGNRTIRLNTDLAKKPPQCLEYILVHEMVHLLEPTHNKRFIALMDQFLPDWQHLRTALNRLPVRQEEWQY